MLTFATKDNAIPRHAVVHERHGDWDHRRAAVFVAFVQRNRGQRKLSQSHVERGDLGRAACYFHDHFPGVELRDILVDHSSDFSQNQSNKQARALCSVFAVVPAGGKGVFFCTPP
jgi:hypothetical protein